MAKWFLQNDWASKNLYAEGYFVLNSSDIFFSSFSAYWKDRYGPLRTWRLDISTWAHTSHTRSMRSYVFFCTCMTLVPLTFDLELHVLTWPATLGCILARHRSAQSVWSGSEPRLRHQEDLNWCHHRIPSHSTCRNAFPVAPKLPLERTFGPLAWGNQK